MGLGTQMAAFLTLGFRPRHLLYTWTPQPRHRHEHSSRGTGVGALHPTPHGMACVCQGGIASAGLGDTQVTAAPSASSFPHGRFLSSTHSTVTRPPETKAARVTAESQQGAGILCRRLERGMDDDSKYIGHLGEEVTHCKRPCCWERLKAKGEEIGRAHV